MGKPTLKEFMHAVFLPLVEASGLTSLLPDLKTAPIAPNTQREQYKRLKLTEIQKADVLYMGNGNFIARINCGDEKYFAINLEYLSADEINLVLEFCTAEGLRVHRMEEAFFLALRFYVGQYYKLKKDLRNQAASKNVLDIVDHSYGGHEISDLIECYENTLILGIPKDSIYFSSTMWYAAVKFSANFSALRSPIITNALAKKLEKLASYDHIPHDNLYVVLTALHWKYAFFELYKCLEKIYFLPWHFKLKAQIGSQISSASLAKICEATIDWRAKEADSIKKLFDLVDESIFGESFRENIVFKEFFTGAIVKTSFGRRVYKMRNILVHQQDYEDKEHLEIDDENWPGVIDLMCDLIENLYVRFNDEIKF